MSSSRGRYHHGNLRHALVEMASGLVRERGAEGFSLREAARLVGVSPNAAYRHFSDKSALLTAVSVAGFETLAARMQRASARARRATEPDALAIARFTAVGRAYVRFALEDPQTFRLMFGPHGVRSFNAQTQSEGATPYELLGTALDDLVTTGVLTEGQRRGAERKAWTVVHGFASLVLEGATTFTSQRERDRALDAVLEFAVAGLAR